MKELIKTDYLRKVLFISLIGLALSCQEPEKKFKIVPPSHSGIEFVNEIKPTEDLNIFTYLYYYNGAGVLVADFNNDGLNDIYFTSNQGADHFYLNKGQLKFEDVTKKSGIENSTGWTTGVTYVDINNDGLLDIYVCKVGNYKTIKGSNLLFVNQGLNENNVPFFKESAHEYGLDIIAFSTQAVFFDYDLDDDLDMYLLCHSVHPNNSYGKGENRVVVDSLSGDRLFENSNNKFIDVSKEAGIFQGKMGYGLGVSIGDLNRDGYPDIYVGNDFFENDYLYQNNGNKTFTELNSKDATRLGHTSHYSMGNAIADMNNDGLPDILSLDMLPSDLVTLKSSGLEDGYSLYNRFLKNGYSPQFMQNTMHLNRGKQIFSEVAFQAGIAATEWSWGVLAADYDMDGYRDLYITNGVLGATNDMDYINFISQDLIQKELGKAGIAQPLEISMRIPEKKTENYSFKNNRNTSFTDVSNEWFEKTKSFSNGGASADLDNDGDLDIIVNNINQTAFVFENQTNNKKAKNYLTFRFRGPKNNHFGIGVKVEVFAGDLYMYEENFPVKSYLSTAPTDIVFGLAEHKFVDSIKVVWPNSASQTLRKVDANQIILLESKNASFNKSNPKEKEIKYLTNTDFSIDFIHHEETTLDFDRDPLVPFALSNEGPRVTILDVNSDLLDDIFIGGAKMQASELFIQNKNGQFISEQNELFSLDAKSEDVDQIFFDADKDSDIDLLIVSGGNEFTEGTPLKPRLYIQESGRFSYVESEFEGVAINASVVKGIDIENDGDIDVVICSNALPRHFGENSKNYIFRNDGNGHFEDISESFSKDFQNVGLITDAVVADFDNNGFRDILVVGTWMPITLFLNNGKSFSYKVLPETEGWWKSIGVADFDKDGDLDFVAGNWGLNSRLTASERQPVKLYRNDFDNNGNTETLITYYYQNKETFLSSKDELARQMPFIKKKYQTYHEFAKAEIKDVFEEDKLNSSIKKQAKILSTCYFENDGLNNFKKRYLPSTAQQSSVNAIAIDDFNRDGYLDVLMVGNNYEISTQLGRLDASHGVLMLNDQSGFFTEKSIQNFDIAGAARDIKKLIIRGEVFYLVTMNNDRPVFLKKEYIR